MRRRSIIVIGNLKVVLAIVALALAIPLATLIVLDASAGDDPVTETIAVARDGATSAEVEVRMGAGTLQLESGATGLMDGTFTSSDETDGHAVDYTVVDGVGRLSIDQGLGSGFVAPWDWGQVENVWDIRLATGLPISLDVHLGAGQGELMLGGLDLTSVSVETGAGSTTVNFDGDWPDDVDASIVAGAGDLTIVVPRDTGVVVWASVGFGEISADGLAKRNGAWVNAAYGVTPATLEIDVKGGLGEVHLVLAPV